MWEPRVRKGVQVICTVPSAWSRGRLALSYLAVFVVHIHIIIIIITVTLTPKGGLYGQREVFMFTPPAGRTDGRALAAIHTADEFVTRIQRSIAGFLLGRLAEPWST